MTATEREWIQKRAYTIWEEGGRQHGRDEIHWQQACSEFQEHSTAKKPAAARKRTAKANDLSARSEAAAQAPPAKRKHKPK